MSKTAEEYSKEPVSHDLEEAAARYERENREIILSSVNIVDAFIAGAEWQKEQKPAEWSEEDEEMLEYVIADVNDAKQLFATKESIDLCDKEIAWLKSLRPSLKPSEEQMEALLNTLHPDDPYYPDLKSLYEQLKKL